MLYQLSYTPAGEVRGYRRRRAKASICAKVAVMHGSNIQPIPSQLLLLAYRAGVFPMADSRDDPEIFWVEPRERATIPLDEYSPSRSLRKVLRQDRFRVSCNEAFGQVVRACAAPRMVTGSDSDNAAEGNAESGSWISHRIEASYRQLRDIGHAHSVECWQDGADGEELVGGLYGVSFDRVFCGESMFSRADNASKVALSWLVAAMRRAGFVLLDCQFMTDHLASLGAAAMPQEDYVMRVKAAQGEPACSLPRSFAAIHEEAAGSPGKLIAQSFTHTS
ncbi:MAG: leucyl/phenylalanyl-tRNA--protein transferase [Alteripontixanthobacter sp.]